MSAFEFVFGFVTIISSLAVTHLAAGLVALIRHSRRIRFSAVQAAFMWAAFTTTVVNWHALWPLQQITSWPSWQVLLWIAFTLAQYVFCALITPELGDGEVDLCAWDDANRSRYIPAVMLLVALAIVGNISFRDFNAGWQRGVAGCLIYGGLALLTVVRNRAVRLPAAVGLAALTTYWMCMAAAVEPMVLHQSR